MRRKRNDRGKFETQYDWPVLIPKICDQFINGASLGTICAQPGYPTPWAVWYAIKHNPEYKREWLWAVRVQMYLLTDELGEIADRCKEAVTNREINLLALRIMMNIVSLKYSNLERIWAKYLRAEKQEESLEDIMREARKRAWGHSGPKPREHNENTRCPR